MKYSEIIKLKDGRECIIRNGVERDGAAACRLFNLTHAQSDFLRTYPEENCFTAQEEGAFLREKTESEREIELVAVVDGEMVGLAGIECVGNVEKLRQRAEFGISVHKDYWGLGIGRAMTRACIKCAKDAGYSQLELDVVAENRAAVSLYKSEGFVEYGRNPKGFRSRITGWQELILMRLEIE